MSDVGPHPDCPETLHVYLTYRGHSELFVSLLMYLILFPGLMMFTSLFVLVVRHLGPGAHDASAETWNGSDRGESGFPRCPLNHLMC